MLNFTQTPSNTQNITTSGNHNPDLTYGDFYLLLVALMGVSLICLYILTKLCCTPPSNNYTSPLLPNDYDNNNRRSYGNLRDIVTRYIGSSQSTMASQQEQLSDPEQPEDEWVDPKSHKLKISF